MCPHEPERRWLRAVANSWRGYVRFGGLAVGASPDLTLVTAACTVVAAVGPLATLAAVAAIVGQVPAVSSAGLSSPAGRAALLWATVVGVLFALQRGAASLQVGSVTALGGSGATSSEPGCVRGASQAP